MIERRWLGPESAATYLDVRIDALPRLVRAGKLPPPDFTLGPKSPRYDKLALDRAMGDPVLTKNPDTALEAWREKFKEKAKGQDRAA